MLPKPRARPLPGTAQLGLAGEAVPARRHGDGVPVLEADVGTGQVEEDFGLDYGWPRVIFYFFYFFFIFSFSFSFLLFFFVVDEG